jgi:hypothetical protein
MKSGPLFALCSALLLTSVIPASATPHVRRGPTAPRLFKSRSAKASNRPAAARSGIAPERATEIQTALIKAGYLSGTPSGTWDSQSQAAMEKLQADNGWQTKLVPDSRAIIKLGLGPNSNPSPAVTASSFETTEAPAAQASTSHFANQ